MTLPIKVYRLCVDLCCDTHAAGAAASSVHSLASYLLRAAFPMSKLCTLSATCSCAFALTFACQSCRIADPEASKPDDWDEDAPREILDEEAEKPEGWLDDEPEEIDDPGQLHMVQLDHCFMRTLTKGSAFTKHAPLNLVRAIIQHACILSFFMDCRSCVTGCCSSSMLYMHVIKLLATVLA